MFVNKLVLFASLQLAVLYEMVEASTLTEFIKFKQVEYENLPSELWKQNKTLKVDQQ